MKKTKKQVLLEIIKNASYDIKNLDEKRFAELCEEYRTEMNAKPKEIIRQKLNRKFYY